MKHCEEDLQVSIFIYTEGNFDTYCESKDVTDFHDLPGKLEHLTTLGLASFFDTQFENSNDVIPMQ